jgi:two-component sensor histidine kinase
MWVGTEGAGAFKLDLKLPKFNCYAPVTGKEAGYMVKSVYKDNTGDIWMGVYDKGLVRYNPTTQQEKRVELPVKKDGLQFSNILRDSSGNIVVAANNQLYWLNAQNNKIILDLEVSSYQYTTDKKPVINVVTEWRKNQYLLGTNMGIYMVNRTAGKASYYVQIPLFYDSTVNGWIYNFHKVANGSIYIGKRNGFAKITFGNDTVHTVLEHGLSNLPVRHFYKSSTTPILWLATEQGLLAYEEGSGKYKVFDEESGIANSYIYAILPQCDSVLWISTNKGIVKAAITYGGLSNLEVRFTNYTSEDGLQSNEFNTGAYYKHQDGTMIFGGISGINWFRPNEVTINPFKAIPSITGIYINDTLMTYDSAMYIDKMVLAYNRNTVSFTMRALEYTTPLNNKFAYMLQGLDKDWVYTSNDKVRYSNLEPGSYVFLLKVSNNEGKWNDEPLQLALIVEPPFWRTWWFRLALLTIGVSLVLLVVRYYTYLKVKAKTIELERQHVLNTERMRISKDVHDDIGSGLSKIALLSALANRKLKENELPSKDIDNISAISKQLVDNMHDLVWVLNPENTTLDNLVSRIREYCADYLDVSDVTSTLSFPDNVPNVSIHGEVQRNIFSTVKEALNNCMKHSKATHVAVTLTMQHEMLEITIVDNGIGFSGNEPTGNGLRNMKNRIEQIHGRFQVTSAVNAGSTLSISIPFSQLSTEEIAIGA